MQIILQGRYSNTKIKHILQETYPDYLVISITGKLEMYHNQFFQEREGIAFIEYSAYPEILKRTVQKYLDKKPKVVICSHAPWNISMELKEDEAGMEQARHKFIKDLLALHKPETFIFSEFSENKEIRKDDIDFINIGRNEIRVLDLLENKLI